MPVTTLIVDDSPSLRRAIADVVHTVPGFVVIGEGTNGLEGVDLARALRPDLVVMDLHMPVMDGLEATRLLKQEVPGTQVVLVSVALEPEIQDAALELGVMAFLRKGEELWSHLPGVISPLLQRSRAQADET